MTPEQCETRSLTRPDTSIFPFSQQHIGRFDVVTQKSNMVFHVFLSRSPDFSTELLFISTFLLFLFSPPSSPKHSWPYSQTGYFKKRGWEWKSHLMDAPYVKTINYSVTKQQTSELKLWGRISNFAWRDEHNNSTVTLVSVPVAVVLKLHLLLFLLLSLPLISGKRLHNTHRRIIASQSCSHTAVYLHIQQSDISIHQQSSADESLGLCLLPRETSVSLAAHCVSASRCWTGRVLCSVRVLLLAAAVNQSSQNKPKEKKVEGFLGQIFIQLHVPKKKSAGTS